MPVIDIAGDARKAFETVTGGGIAIGPADTGYSICAATTDSVRRINETKGRGGHKRNAILGSAEIHRQVHVLRQDRLDMIRAVTEDYDLPLAVVAPFRADHPLMRQLDDDLVKTSTASGTIGMLLNAGAFMEELAAISLEAGRTVLGSSANISGSGTKWRVEDIQPEITGIADLIVDYGVRRYHPYRRAGTMINFDTLDVIRMGVCYESIAHVLKRHFDVDLPPDPGFEASPSGHIDEFALEKV